MVIDGSTGSNGCHTCGKDTPPTTGGGISYKDDSACINGDSNRGGR